MSRYVQVKVRKRRLVADALWTFLTSETFLLLAAAAVLGVLLGGVLGAWGGPLR